MSKINEQEYHILKNLNSRWKWIARDDLYNDYDGVCIYTLKPVKDGNEWTNYSSEYEYLDADLFQFIKWSDKEPYSIAELIEEYESEQENNEHETSPQKPPVIPRFVANKLEQCKADGIQVAVIFHGALNSDYDTTLNDWIMNNQKLFSEAFFAYPNIEVEEEPKFHVRDDKGNTLLLKVTKGFGINDRTGEVVHSSNVGEKTDSRLTEQEIKDYDEKYWVFAKPVEELEEEQKFYVSKRDEEYGGFWYLFKNKNGGISIGVARDCSDVDWDKTKLTEQEIRGYDHRAWAIAKPVGEVE